MLHALGQYKYGRIVQNYSISFSSFLRFLDHDFVMLVSVLLKLTLCDCSSLL